jgi:phosphoglycolate phosphatase-like HAD superfamily hydrolase
MGGGCHLEFMRQRSTLFWDFDGVIKDSVGVKGNAYTRLFESFGPAVAARVRAHHERNGGMSRFEKIPLYLEWAGQLPSSEQVEQYCAAFAAAVRNAVIDSAWVPGAREYLEANYTKQRFVLVTATPQAEIEDILRILRIAGCFREVHGAPTAKSDAIASVLARWHCSCADALAIGDSLSDYEAATNANIEFMLRRTELNQNVQRIHCGAQCGDFLDG